MNRTRFDQFEKVVGQLQAVYDELAVLSKKSPSDAVNLFKLRLVNKLLADAAELLSPSYLPFPDFSQFDVDDVPQNSDAVFMMAQYLQCLEKLRADNVVLRGGAWHWEIDNPDHSKTYVRTATPRRLRD